MNTINEDFASTGKCNVMISKEKFWDVQISFAMAKNSQYLQAFDYG